MKTRLYNDTYYVAWTPFQYVNGVVAISVTNMDEAIKLATHATPMLVQIVPEPPMTYAEVTRFLDKLASIEQKEKISFKFMHGIGVDPQRFNTL